MSLPKPLPQWSIGLLLGLVLCCGCQRAVPRVVAQRFDSAAPTATTSQSAGASDGGAQIATGGGWKSTASPAFSTNGVPIAAATSTVPASGAVAVSTPDTAAALTANAVASPSNAVVAAEPAAPRAATLSTGTSPTLPQANPSTQDIRQTQYLAAATDRDMETLRQRLEQQTQVNAALTDAIIQLQRQTEAHHKAIVQVADELNARQARQDKVTEEILSLIDQLAGGTARPGSSASSGAGGGEAAGAGGKK